MGGKLRVGLCALLAVASCPQLSAQADSALYTSGHLPTRYEATISLLDNSFNCSDTLRVNIPPGQMVTGVDVYYAMEALSSNNAWVSDQGSFLEFLNTGTQEAAVSFGDPNWDSAGVMTYTRTGLTLANGISASGQLDFFLHSFRDAVAFPICNAITNRIVDSTWKIVVHYQPPPTCPAPSGLNVFNTGTNTANLNWNSGGASDWQISYGPPGFVPGSGSVVNTSANPHLLTGLTPGSYYEVYVRDSCGPSDLSSWHGPVSFFTNCAFYTAPWSENFNSPIWISGTGGLNTGAQLSPCWIQGGSGNPHFSTRSGPTGSVNTGPNTDVSGSGNYLYTEYSGSTGIAQITSPKVYIPSGLSNPGLSFSYHMYGDQIDSLWLEVDAGSGYQPLYTLVGEHQNSNTDAWKSASAGLATYAGDTVEIRFNGLSSGFNGDIAIDEVEIKSINCLQPQNLVATNVGSTGLDLTWQSGGASLWQVGYRLAGSGTAYTWVSATTNPFSLTGLMPGTQYEITVRDSCAQGSTSLPAASILVQTSCAALGAPWSENFDSPQWVSGTGGPNTGNQLAPCWSRPTPQNPNFGTRTGPTTSVGTGPSADYSGSGNYLYTEASGAQGTGEVTSPEIFIPTSWSAAELSFYSHMFGANIDSLVVEIDNGTGFTAVYSLVGQQQAGNSAPWQQNMVDLQSYIGDTLRIRFLGTNSGFPGDIAIDEVSVLEPTCPAASGLTALQINTNSVELDWTGGGATHWQVGYRIVGSGAPYSTVTTSTKPFVVTGLQADTHYEFVVRDSCGANDLSLWSNAIQLRTLCPVITAPWLENFDAAPWIPGTGATNQGHQISTCWSRPVNANPHFSTGSGFTVSVNTGPSTDFSGSGNYIYTEATGATGTGEIVTPRIYLDPAIQPRLKFQYHMYGSAIDSLVVAIDNGSGYQNLWSRIGPQQAAETDPWLQQRISLAAYAGDTVQIRFTGTNNGFMGDIALDEVEIDDEPPCPDPDSLQVVSVTGNSVDLVWRSGGASQWQIEYGPAGFTPGQGTVVAAGSNPFSVTGLNANTNYDFYIRDSCSATLVSNWAGPVAARTACGIFVAPYAENFDGSDWVPGAGGLNAGNQVSPCWIRPAAQNPDFSTGQGTTPSANTGPAGDHSGTGKYLYTEASGGATGPGEIISPEIYLPGASGAASLSFYYHIYGVNIISLAVEVDNGSGFTQIWSLTGQQQNASTDAWQQQLLDLSSYSGDTVRIKWVGVNTGFTADISIDEVVVDTLSCTDPVNLQLTGRSFDRLFLDWDSVAGSTWEVQAGPPGFHPDSGSPAASYTNVAPPFAATGLSSGTQYCLFVRQICGNATSNWVQICGSTQCTPFAMPWLEDFEGGTWQTGTGTQNLGNQIDPCWERPSNDNPNFSPWSGPTASANTGPDGGFNGSSQYIVTEYTGATGPPGEITSPWVVINSAASNPELSFWYHMFGNGIDSLVVYVEANGQNQFLLSFTGPQQTASTDNWEKASADLSAYSGDTVRVHFLGYAQNFMGDIALDDVRIEDNTCPDPDNLQITAVTDSSVSLNWTGGSAPWQLEYRPVGSGTYTRISVANRPVTVNALQPGTLYEFRVRDSCGVGEYSDWLVPVDTLTDCRVALLPWSENFDQGAWQPGTGGANTGDLISACWSRPNANAYRWSTGSGGTPSASTGPAADVSGSGQYIYTEASLGNGSTEIYSPSIYLDPQWTQIRLEYYLHMYGQNIQSLEVAIDPGNGFQVLRTFNGQQQSSGAAAWLKDTVGLQSFVGDTVQLRFTGTINNGFMGDIALDQISITASPVLCTPPAQLSFTNLDITSVDINWQPAAQPVELEVVPAGQPQGSGTVNSAAAAPFSLTGLNPATSYDIYLRSLCGTLNSTFVDSTFTTLACPAVQAGFTAQRNFLRANFDTNNTSGADSLFWDFGDGNSDTAAQPVHIYNAPGTYTILLVAWNGCGNGDTTTQSLQICDTLRADFSFSQSGDTVFFDGDSSQNASYYLWILPSGDTLSGLSAAHSFNSAGTKQVTLLVANACGDTATTQKNVKVCLPPVASWTYNIISTTGNGMDVQFDGSASLNASNYFWDFGDGNTLAGAVQPVHTYVTPGLFYTVSLRVENDCGDRNTRKFRLSEIGLEELSEDRELSLFPNPTRRELTLEWSAGPAWLQGAVLYNASGQKVWQAAAPANQSEEWHIGLPELAPGVYYLWLHTAQGSLPPHKVLIRP